MAVPSNPLTDRAGIVWPPSPRLARPAATLERLRSMSLTEIAYRSRQEASKAFERLAPSGRLGDSGAWLRQQAPSLAAPGAALRALREGVPGRFFPGASEPDTARVVETQFPGARRQILAAADAALEGRFDLLGYRGLWFGDPIDWHLDPVWSRRAPLLHWSRIDPLDPAIVGDSKVVWELNRQQWLVRVAQAWRLTGATEYATACVETIDRWRNANPPGMGVNWASSLEVAFRLMSWCWVLVLIKDAPVLSERWAAGVMAAVWQHAAHISRYLSYYSSPNTHLTGEALGLFYAGTLFPEFRDAARWRAVATRVLLAECRTQITADGVHFEQATCYQRYTIDIYLAMRLLADRNGVALPREVNDRTQRLVDFLAAVQRPDGTIPSIGDADGGELMPLTDRDPDDGRGTFAVAAARFARPDFAWAARGPAPELVWLMGRGGLAAFEALVPAPPAAAPSQLFPSGYAVMRSGWTADAHQLIADVGPLGCPASSGHGHADLLSVQCSVFGDPCLVDAGTYCYTPEPRWRDYFRGTAAHSTVRVDGIDQAEPAGPFRWRQRPRARVSSWHSNAETDVLDAMHDGYQRLADPVTCRRRVVFVKPEYWLIADDVEGAAGHQIEVTFQFAAGVRVSAGPDGWVRAETVNGRVLWVLAVAATPVETVIACGEHDPLRGWTSPDYGQRQPAPALVLSAAATLPWRMLTLLVPDAEGLTPPPSVSAIVDPRGLPIGVHFQPPRRSVRLDDRSVVIT